MVDVYSAVEIGYIALQCPEHPHYHVQAENVLVEIIDADGRPCAPGQIGRVVITTLHNYATPLIRYEIGDFAVAGAPCPCGRGLPVIERILGRYRNLLTLPNGSRLYPQFGHNNRYPDAVRQMQLVQTHVDAIKVRLVADHEMTAAELEAINRSLTSTLGHRFDFAYEYVTEIGRSRNGKFEEFVSLLSATDGGGAVQ